MPRIHIKERSDKVKTKRRSKRNNDNSGPVTAKERFEEVVCTTIGIEFSRFRIRKCSDDKENGQNYQVQLNEREDHKGRNVCPPRSVHVSAVFDCLAKRGLIYLPFRPITQRQDELQQEESQVESFHNLVEEWGNVIAKRKSANFRLIRIRRANQVHDNRCSKPEGSYECVVS